MALYLDTRGHTMLSPGICARCKRKFPLDELRPDPNVPGLLVCDEDRDVFDPWRLPTRALERISVTNPRPDVSLALDYSGSVDVPLTISIFGINTIYRPHPWRPNARYSIGDSITPLNVDLDTVPLTQNQYLCIIDGVSGPVAPIWPTEPGVILGDYISLTNDDAPALQLLTDAGLTLLADSNGDGTICWLNLGPYLL